MRATFLAVFATACISGPAFADPIGDALSAKVDTCIRTHAAGVAALSPNPHDAVNFLVDDLCVVQIQHAETYASSVRSLEQWRSTMAASQVEGVKINPETGELTTPPGFAPGINTTAIMLTAMRVTALPQAHYRAVAAEAVLAARTASAH